MKAKLSINDFDLEKTGYGMFRITYMETSNNAYTIDCFCNPLNNSGIINKTFNAENPKQKDLRELKKLCIENGINY